MLFGFSDLRKQVSSYIQLSRKNINGKSCKTIPNRHQDDQIFKLRSLLYLQKFTC